MKIDTKDEIVLAVLKKMDQRSIYWSEEVRSYNDARNSW
jgi:hypothetical protein